MKKIIALILALSLSVLTLATLVSCGEKEYTLSIAVDDGFKTVSKNKVTNIALALVTDADGKIVAARFDSFEQSFQDDKISADRIVTKVEKGDDYTGMEAGSWEVQAKAFEDAIIGKTAEEVAAIEGLVAGCTMKSSTPVFKALVAKADAYGRKVSFKASGDITLGLGIDAKASGNALATKISADYAAVAVAGGKVVAAMLDSAEATYAATIPVYAGTKNEQGDAYDSSNPMKAGRWYAQAQAFANTAVGKTVAELADLSTDKIEGSCTISTGGYKAVIVRAAGNAR